MNDKKTDLKKIIKKIEVLPYNPNWPKIFSEESDLIKRTLGDQFIDIQHVGSTSVIGLSAKPRIDIICVVKDPKGAINLFESIGYQYKGEYNIPFHFGFSKRNDHEFNLHVYEEGNPEIELNILFRDYLRNHPDALNEYAKLKEALLSQEASFEKNNSLFTGYNLGKDNFIRKIIQKTGFEKVRLHHCTHIEEWKAAKIFRQKYFFDNVPIEDPYTWTFNHPEHIHLVLLKGTTVVGYAHLQRWPEQRVAMRIIVIDELYRGQGLGRQLLMLCEKWLKTQGYHILQTEASPAALAFYEKYGYQKMPFNDPDGYESHPQDIAVGKVL